MIRQLRIVFKRAVANLSFQNVARFVSVLSKPGPEAYPLKLQLVYTCAGFVKLQCEASYGNLEVLDVYRIVLITVTHVLMSPRPQNVL